jgi:hypothetical protein
MHTGSDVNVHKTNSFFRPNFQFVLFLRHCDRKENKNRFVQKYQEKNQTRTKHNKFLIQSKKTNCFRY